jgi:hypothetical protein
MGAASKIMGTAFRIGIAEAIVAGPLDEGNAVGQPISLP